MSLSPKTITVFLDASPSSKMRATHAALLGLSAGAYLVGVDVLFAGVQLPPSMSYARGDEALKHVAAYKRQTRRRSRSRRGSGTRALPGSVHRTECSGRVSPNRRENSVEEAIHIAFNSDLVVVGHPEPHGLPDDLSVEKLLLASGGLFSSCPMAGKARRLGTTY